MSAPLASHGEASTPFQGTVDMGLAPGESMRGVRGTEGTAGFSAYDDVGSVSKQGKFSVPVDSENKACEIRLYSFAAPHMRALHLAWFGFFTAFFSTFAPAPLLPIIRDDLDLDSKMTGYAGTAAVIGAVFSRICMGMICDLYGPRIAFSLLLLATSIPCFAMTSVTNFAGFVAARFFIGFGLATFVTCQYWCSTMFTPKIVGGANAIAGGWGNLGGGITQIVIPVIATAISRTYNNDFKAWRQTFFLPGCMHIVAGMAIYLLGVDKPDGNVSDLKRTGAIQVSKNESWITFKNAVLNYRTWCFVFSYGFCFGVELVVDNLLAGYFNLQFGLGINQAGLIASFSGLMNICSRALGGIFSDIVARRYGMRGRLWFLWFTQTASGGVCVAMAQSNASLSASTTTMVIFSFLTQMSCGATYGIVPFISRRSLGVISGMVGAGGNGVSGLLQQVFFTGRPNDMPYTGLQHLGITIMCCTMLLSFVHFPMWGSMFFGPSKGKEGTEQEFYLKDYTAEERETGKADHVSKFAMEAANERGSSMKGFSEVQDLPDNDPEKAAEMAEPIKTEVIKA